MSHPQVRIAYITNLNNTFTKIDENILRERYDLESICIRDKNPKFIAPLWQTISKSDLVIAWFASWHSLPAFTFAKLMNKPRILITGGYDVANEPSINYGLRRGGLPYMMSDLVFRLTDTALPFSETAFAETIKNTPLSESNTQALALGVPDKIAFHQQSEKQHIAITVGGINQTSVIRKGIQEFVESAKFLPDIKFIVVGKHNDNTINELRTLASDNVEFTGFISDEALDNLLISAKVYVQASQHEGFGLSVAQAMLARCIPIVTRKGSLPEVVADTGIYLENRKPQHIADKITEIIDDTTLGEDARQRILDHFSIEQRAKGLYNAIDRLLR